MTAKEIYNKTMPFVWAKLTLGGATVLISIILFAILMGIGWLFGDGGMLITLIIWIGATSVVRFVIMHYMGYLVKAGHIAIISEAVTTGQVPDNQVAVGKAMVTERFATSNIYFAVDKLVAAAVKQLQNGLQKVGNALDFIPGMSAVTGLGKFFIELSLGYIDECCLGYTFYKKEQGAFQSAADGVVIYAQNWKVLLKNAAKTMGIVLLAMAGVILLSFIVLGLLFKLLHWSSLVAFLLACLIAWTIKFAFIDSWILVRMMVTYMDVAPSTSITFDLYGKLCNFSSKFKELFTKGQRENPQRAQPAYAAVGGGPAIPQNQAPPAAAPAISRPVFCGSCGARNEAETKFCGSCGAKM